MYLKPMQGKFLEVYAYKYGFSRVLKGLIREEIALFLNVGKKYHSISYKRVLVAFMTHGPLGAGGVWLSRHIQHVIFCV